MSGVAEAHAAAVSLARLCIVGGFAIVAGWWLLVQCQRWVDDWRWKRMQKR